MCLAIPMRVKAVKGNEAIVEVGGAEYRANVQLVDNVKVGDYLIVHAGFAIEKLDEEEAMKSLEAWEELFSVIGEKGQEIGKIH